MMICSILAHACALIKYNNLLILLELYFHFMKVKQHTINMLAELDIISDYQIINKYAELINLEKV